MIATKLKTKKHRKLQLTVANQVEPLPPRDGRRRIHELAEEREDLEALERQPHESGEEGEVEEEGGGVAEGGVGGSVDGHHVRGLGDEQHQAEVLHREVDFQVPGKKLFWC